MDGAGAGGVGPPSPRRRTANRSGRTAVLVVVGISALGGLGFGLWAGLTRKAPARAGDPGSGVAIEGLGVQHPPRSAAPAGTEPAPAIAPAPAPGQRKPGQTLREIQALVAADKISAARAVAEEFLKTTPTGPEAEQIMGLTGVHPHP
jgi:hypothetical protein